MRPAFRKVIKIGGGILALPVVYLVLLAHPQPLFSYSTTVAAFTFYSNTPLNGDPSALASQVLEKVKQSGIYDPTIQHCIFITDSSRLYGFLNGPYRSAIARNYELGNCIFVPTLDVAGAAIIHFDGQRAGAVNILAHEVMHTYVQRRVGLLTLWRLPWWKKEGYAEYIASDRMLHSEAPARYREAAIAWKYLLEQKRFTFDQVIATQLTLAAIEEEIRAGR